jgi:hemerythrin-like metal-binding protein
VDELHVVNGMVFDMEWTEDRIAVAQLNEQHAELYRVVYALYDAIREGPPAALAAGLERLRLFAGEHFAAEERRMTAAGYPLARQHGEMHEGFVSQLAGYAATLAAEGMQATLLLTLSRYVSEWMSVHVAGPDLAFHSFAQQREDACAAA